MIGAFFKTHRWLFTGYIVIFLMFNMLFLLDDGFANISVLYVDLGYVLCGLLFCTLHFFDWKKRFEIDSMEQLEQNDWISGGKALAEYEALKAELKEMKLAVLEQQDEKMAWIHEMKSPLTSMQLLIEGLEASDTKIRLEQQWLRTFLLVDQQLYESRFQTMEQDMYMAPVDVRKIISTEIRNLKNWCMSKGIGFDFEGTMTVMTDEKWIGFIIRQLLTNAVKYSKENEEITIRLEEHTLTITDRGVGIAPQDLPRIFRKSYTGTVGRESNQATGMGLYLAKNAADNLGITLAVTSVLGQGTTVTVTFPHQNAFMKTYGM